MGIDVYLSWNGQTPEEIAAQDEAYLNLDAGAVGYLRESYSGGPYVTKILARDAFESPSREARIPAAVLRERLTRVTEPAYGFDAGDVAVREITEQPARPIAEKNGRNLPKGPTDPVTNWAVTS